MFRLINPVCLFSCLTHTPATENFPFFHLLKCEELGIRALVALHILHAYKDNSVAYNPAHKWFRKDHLDTKEILTILDLIECLPEQEDNATGYRAFSLQIISYVPTVFAADISTENYIAFLASLSADGLINDDPERACVLDKSKGIFSMLNGIDMNNIGGAANTMNNIGEELEDMFNRVQAMGGPGTEKISQSGFDIGEMFGMIRNLTSCLDNPENLDRERMNSIIDMSNKLPTDMRTNITNMVTSMSGNEAGAVNIDDIFGNLMGVVRDMDVAQTEETNYDIPEEDLDEDLLNITVPYSDGDDEDMISAADLNITLQELPEDDGLTMDDLI